MFFDRLYCLSWIFSLNPCQTGDVHRHPELGFFLGALRHNNNPQMSPRKTRTLPLIVSSQADVFRLQSCGFFGPWCSRIISLASLRTGAKDHSRRRTEYARMYAGAKALNQEEQAEDSSLLNRKT